MILVLILYLLFASTFILGKIALTYTQPIFFIGIRMLIGGAILLAYQYLRKLSSWQFSKKEIWLYLQLMFFHIFAAFTLEFWALQYVSAAKVCLIYNSSPFITALLSYLIFNERIKKKQVLGLVIGFCGLLPILLSGDPLEYCPGSIFFVSLPELALLGSVTASAYGWMVFKQCQRQGISSWVINGIAMVGGGLMALITAFLVEKGPWLRVGCSINECTGLLSCVGSWQWSLANFLFYMMLLIMIANIICYNLYGLLLRRYSATFLAFAGFMTPFFAAFYDWILLGQVVSWHFYLSAGITLLGLYLFYRQEMPLSVRPE